jgi:hypothetical protein
MTKTKSKEDVYQSSDIRRACKVAYEREIYPVTWKNWRICSGIKERTYLLTEKQAKTLVAIAFLRNKQRSISEAEARKEIKAEDVIPIREHKSFNAFFLDCLSKVSAQAYKEKRVYGRDLPKYLNVSETTLRKEIPSFSFKTCYKISVLQKNYPDLFTAIDLKID